MTNAAKKSFVRTAHLGATILPSWKREKNRATFYAGFLQCNLLSDFVAEKPKSFIIEYWESSDNIRWEKKSQTTYSNVVWHGHVHHSDPEEMSACKGEIDFSYDDMVHDYNCNEFIILDEHSKPFMWEFIDLTENPVLQESSLQKGDSHLPT